jgi:hypothetical protein
MGSLSRKSTGEWVRSLAGSGEQCSRIADALQSLVFFALFYLYLWLYVDLCLIAHGAGLITNFPAFFADGAYFREFTAYPGGIVHYAAAFLSQLFYVGWAGAGVATTHAWITCACTGYILRRFGLPAARWLRFVPALLLLAAYAQLTYHFITAAALTVALLFTCLYLVITDAVRQTDTTEPPPAKPQKKAVRRALAFAALSLVLYPIAGGAWLVFVVLCTAYEILRRRVAYGLTCLLAGSVLPYVVGVWGFSASPANAYGNLLPFVWETFALQGADKGITLIYACYAFVPALAWLAVLWRMRAILPIKARAVKTGHKPKAERPTRPPSSLLPALRWIFEIVVLVALAGGTAFVVRDDYRRALFEVDFYASHNMWSRVLQAGRSYSAGLPVAHAIDRALYHTGRLGYDMFAYPQSPDALLLTGQKHVSDFWRKIDMYLELGHMNLAENALCECTEFYGEQPYILRRLAIINMVKGRIESAEVYLRALSKTLPERDWARSYLRRLAEDPEFKTDADIQHLRSIMVRADHVAAISPENLLLDPLRANPNNQMAFEYLMALYMLSLKLDRMAEHYPLVDQMEYTELPRLYQEALLLHVVQTKKPFDLRGRQNSPDLSRRFENFNAVVRRHRNNPKAAFGELARLYGDSYFFYHLYPNRVPGTGK